MTKRANLKEIIDNNIFKISKSTVDARKAKNLLSGAGIDYLPETDIEIYFLQVGNNPDDLIVFALNDGLTKEVDKGEIKIYSVLSGILKSFVYCKNNGDIILNDDSDNAVRYSKLEQAFNQLKQDFDDFVSNQHNSSVVPHTHQFSYNAGPTPATGNTNPAIITTGNSSTADITPAKIDNIKVPS